MESFHQNILNYYNSYNYAWICVGPSHKIPIKHHTMLLQHMRRDVNIFATNVKVTMFNICSFNKMLTLIKHINLTFLQILVSLPESSVGRNDTLSVFSLCLALSLLKAQPRRLLTTIPHSSQARLDLEAATDPKLLSPGSPLATGSFPHSISMVTERDKWLGQG